MLRPANREVARILATNRETVHRPISGDAALAVLAKSGEKSRVMKTGRPTSLLEGRCSIQLSYGRVDGMLLER